MLDKTLKIFAIYKFAFVDNIKQSVCSVLTKC